MRDDEELARNIFVAYLRDRLNCPVSATDGNDPPDFDLDVAGRNFPLEVTTIMDHALSGSNHLPVIALESAIRKWGDQIEREALERKILFGRYVVHSNQIADFRAEQDLLKKNLFECLNETASAATAPSKILWSSDREPGQWSTEKTALEPSRIYVMPLVRQAQHEGEAEERLRSLIIERVSDKSRKLADFADPILLLIDNLKTATADAWERALTTCPNHPFHTIARIHQGQFCQVIMSKDDLWALPIT